MLKQKQAEAESSAIKLAAMEEKYEFDKKEYLSKEQNFRTREKSYEHQLEQLATEIEIRKGNDGRVKDLKV